MSASTLWWNFWSREMFWSERLSDWSMEWVERLCSGLFDCLIKLMIVGFATRCTLRVCNMLRQNGPLLLSISFNQVKSCYLCLLSPLLPAKTGSTKTWHCSQCSTSTARATSSSTKTAAKAAQQRQRWRNWQRREEPQGSEGRLEWLEWLEKGQKWLGEAGEAGEAREAGEAGEDRKGQKQWTQWKRKAPWDQSWQRQFRVGCVACAICAICISEREGQRPRRSLAAWAWERKARTARICFMLPMWRGALPAWLPRKCKGSRQAPWACSIPTHAQNLLGYWRSGSHLRAQWTLDWPEWPECQTHSRNHGRHS